jgi:hypothetical protein
MYGRMSAASRFSAGARAHFAGTSPSAPARGYGGAAAPFSVAAEKSRDGPAWQWPLQSFLELGALPGAAPCARLHARNVLWEWRLAALGDNAELLVSELVTNAAQASREAGPCGTVRLWLRADRQRLLILVWDASERPPARMQADSDAESGRGLQLIDAVADRWDWYYPPREEGGGKVVWALLHVR